MAKVSRLTFQHRGKLGKGFLKRKLYFMDNDSQDREFLAGIFLKYYSGLYNYGLKISGLRDITKDAIQNLFIQLWNNRKNLTSIEDFRAYLFRGLRNNLLRDLKANGKKLTLDENGDQQIEFSHEDLLISKEKSLEIGKIVSHSLNKLPTRQKEIIFLRFYNDLSYRKNCAMI